MSIGRSQRAVISWIATLAILMASLVPAISHALSAAAPPSWTEICTSNGSRLMPAQDDAAKPHGVPGAAHLLEHCPSCAVHADALGLPPLPPAALPPAPV